MPLISTFYGILIRMFYNDHAPPHFHAVYGEFEIRVEIQPPRIMTGEAPLRVQAMVLEWATLHQVELLADWELARQARPLDKIPPLP
ncbi:MAG: hypothetical protein FD180_1663 [Planctomycetota bacterium]|nr:MAG: hypothetical protein FD180_1663 [Planctomycetota bacterium]